MAVDEDQIAYTYGDGVHVHSANNDRGGAPAITLLTVAGDSEESPTRYTDSRSIRSLPQSPTSKAISTSIEKRIWAPLKYVAVSHTTAICERGVEPYTSWAILQNLPRRSIALCGAPATVVICGMNVDSVAIGVGDLILVNSHVNSLLGAAINVVEVNSTFANSTVGLLNVKR